MALSSGVKVGRLGRMVRGSFCFVTLVAATFLAACGETGLAEPTATPLFSGEVGDALRGTGLPPSWTPEGTPTSPGTAPPQATPTSTLTPSPFPSPTLGAGWIEYVVPEASVALRLPPTWLSIPLEGQEPNAVVAQLGQDDAALAASLRHGLPDEMLQTVQFIAFDSAAALRDSAFVSTMRVGKNASDTIDDSVARREASLEADPSMTLEADWPMSVGFEARSGWLVRYTSVYPPDAPIVTTSHTQVFADNGRGEVVVFTFSTEGALADGYERLFELVLDGVHFSLTQ